MWPHHERARETCPPDDCICSFFLDSMSRRRPNKSDSDPAAAAAALKHSRLLLSVAGSRRNDSVTLALKLISLGADVNAADDTGFTSLAMAGRAGNAELVTALLRSGADPLLSTRKNNNGPLFWAAAGGHTAVVKLLLDASADAGQENSAGDTALMWACRSGAVDVSDTLLAAWPALLPRANRQGMTALICAAAGGHVALVSALLSRQPAPELATRDANGRTALHFAAGAGAANAVRALLAAGADATLRDREGVTALGAASKERGETAGAEECVAALEAAWARQCAALELSDDVQIVREGASAGTPPSPGKRRWGRPREKSGRRSERRPPGSGEWRSSASEASERLGETEPPDAAVAATGQADSNSAGGKDGDDADEPTLGAAAEANVAAAEVAKPPPDDCGWEPAPTRRRKGAPRLFSRDVAPNGAGVAPDARQKPTEKSSAPAAAAAAPTKAHAAAAPKKPPAAAALSPAPADAAATGGAAAAAYAAAPQAAPSMLAASDGATEPSANSARRSGGTTDGEEGTEDDSSLGRRSSATYDGELEKTAWFSFLISHPTVAALDLQLHHLLGQRTEELSMAQVMQLQVVQRSLAAQLEEVRIDLVRKQEREAVEARLSLEFEKVTTRGPSIFGYRR